MRAREGSARRAREFRARRRQRNAAGDEGGASPEDSGRRSSGVLSAEASVVAGSGEQTQGRDAPGPGRPEEPTIDQILARHPRYSGEQAAVIRDYWDAVRFTRKSGKIAGTVIAREMDYWERFAPGIVMAALKIHIRKYRGKDEKYTEGIMRRLEKERERGGSYEPDVEEPRATERALAADSRYSEYDAVWRGP